MQSRKSFRWTSLELWYTIGVTLKGVDGTAEVLIGLLLLFAPGLAASSLSAVAAEAGESTTPVRQWISAYVGNLDHQVIVAGVGGLVVFLLLHGFVKLALVYCLFRKYHRVYPYALAVLIFFLGVQVYALAANPTISLAVLCVLDMIIIVLVFREYRVLLVRSR